MGNTCDCTNQVYDQGKNRSLAKLRESKRTFTIPKSFSNNDYFSKEIPSKQSKILLNNDAQAISRYSGYLTELLTTGSKFEDDKYLMFEDCYSFDKMFSATQKTKSIGYKDIQQKDPELAYLTTIFYMITEYPEIISNFLITKHNAASFNVARTWPNGLPTLIVVDDKIPIEDFNPKYTSTSLYAPWVYILEKVWAKMLGSYNSIKGLSPEDALQELLGIPSYSFSFSESDPFDLERLVEDKRILILTAKQNMKSSHLYQNQVFYTLKIQISSNNKKVYLLSPYKDFVFTGQFQQENRTDGIIVASFAEIDYYFEYLTIGYYKNTYKNTHFSINFKNQPIYYAKFQVNSTHQLAIRIVQVYEQYVKDPEYTYSPVYLRLFNYTTGELISQGCKRAEGCIKSANVFEEVMRTLKEGEYFLVVEIEWIRPDIINTANLLFYSNEDILLEKIGRLEGENLCKKYIHKIVQSNSFQRKQNLQYCTIAQGHSILIFLRNTEIQNLRLNIYFPNIYNLRPLRTTFLRNTIQIELTRDQTQFIEFRKIQPRDEAQLSTYEIEFI